MFKLKLHLHGAEVKELQLVSGRAYTFGRGANCDVPLEEQPGISRTHFRLSDEEGPWVVHVVSKFGDVIHSGQPVQNLTLEPGSVFQLGAYDFRFEEVGQASAKNEIMVTSSESNVLNLPTLSSQPVGQYAGQQNSAIMKVTASGEVAAAARGPVREFKGNDEATRVMQVEAEIPYLRIVEPGGVEDLIKLDGRRWIAGREEASGILLNDRKASRRQFELSATPQGFFVRDLGSSNGTLLNGMPLEADELKPIRSGDVLQVGFVALHFEVRDPNFERRLMVVPPEVRSEAPIVMQNTYEMINYPVASGPGGAVRIDQYDSGKNKIVAFAMGEDLTDEKAKKKRRFMVIVASLAVLGAGFSMVDLNPPPKKVAAQQTGYEKLSPPQQQIVKETFVLAKNLYMQKKLALAAEQLQKIHNILPEGYENSVSMADDCAQAKQQEENLGFIEAQKRKQDETNRIIADTLQKCDRLAHTTLEPDLLRTCMMPALELAPDDPKVKEMQTLVDRRIAEHNEDVQHQRRRAGEISRGRALYKKAEDAAAAGEDLEAIQTYKRYVTSGFPDPDGYKTLAQKNLGSLTQRLSSKVDDALRGADGAFAQQNYKDALIQIKRAKALDPNNAKAAEMNAKVRRELNGKLKELYEESVISEGLGKVDEARGNWKKIMDLDLPEGDYYKKAKSKLRSYGST